MALRLAALACALLLPLAAASHTDCVQDVPGAVAFGPYYVYNELCQPGCLYSILIFEEVNGIAGLQSDEYDLDTPCYPPGVREDVLVS